MIHDLTLPPTKACSSENPIAVCLPVDCLSPRRIDSSKRVRRSRGQIEDKLNSGRGIIVVYVAKKKKRKKAIHPSFHRATKNFFIVVHRLLFLPYFVKDN